MGIRCVFVIETPREVPIILKCAEEMKVEPILGVRVKLSLKAKGHWNESGGDRSVFGLDTSQLIEVVDQCRMAGAEHVGLSVDAE